MSTISASAEPLVSVILPVYNGATSIGDTLDSAIRQTYRNIEIIVVDDGSTDHTLKIVEARAAEDPRIHVMAQPNCGVSRARNAGLKAARGEFIAPLDADDLWDPSKIERQVTRMEEAGDETGLVYCWWMWIDEQGTVLDRSPRWAIEGTALETLLRVNFTGNASVPLFRRRAIEEVGAYNEVLEQQNSRGCEDWDLALKVAERYQVAVVPALLVGYRRLPDSMSTHAEVMWRSQTEIVRHLREREPALPSELFQESSAQFALYISGVMFRTGSFFQAVCWALRAWRSPLLYHVLPYIGLFFAKRLFSRQCAEPKSMTPGRGLDESWIAEPLIPYDRIHARIQRARMQRAHAQTSRERGEDGPAAAFLRAPLWQAVFVVIAFLSVAALHVHNDGLWFQGDAPRHGANGFFWWDLVTNHPASPVGFAVRYYARYPVINPLTYPPLFYLLEGFAFRTLADSPFVAKSLILIFGMMAGLYTSAWARRWMGPEAGWAGGFLAFVPGVVLWTNAVMLNVPAMALALACLYHWRRWIETPVRKQLIAASLFGLAAVLTYYQAAVVLGVCVAWALLLRRDVAHRGFWLLGIALLAIASGALALRVAPVFVTRHLPSIGTLASAETWRFYAQELPRLFGLVWLLLGLGGLIAAGARKPSRREATYLGSWILVPILVLSILPAKDARYILSTAPAIVLAAALAVSWILRILPSHQTGWRVGALAAGAAGGFWVASLVPVPQTSGFREVAEYLRQNAPLDGVVYDGYHDGLFGFYVRAMDPNFERRVILGQEFLYHYGPTTSFNWVETPGATTVQGVVDALRNQSGCRWVAVEIGSHSEWARGQKLLREAVRHPEFELVRSFPVVASTAQRVDLYRLVGPVSPVSTVDLRPESYSELTFEHVVPIER